MTDYDKDNWPRANNDATIVLVVAAIAILVVMGAYAYARYLIGMPL